MISAQVRALAEDEAIYARFGNNVGPPRILDVTLADSYWADLRRVTTQKLVVARLEHAFVRGSLQPLQGAHHLTSLCLAGCDSIESDLKPLSSLSGLRLLNLHGCDKLYGDLEPLAQLTDLEHLHLSWTNFKGHITSLTNLHRLKTLALDWCSDLRGNLAETFCPNTTLLLRRRQHLMNAMNDDDDDLPCTDAVPPLHHVSVYRAFRISGLDNFILARPTCRLDR